MNISIYGIGNFGYAFLKHLDNKKSPDLRINAYDRNSELIEHLQKTRSHLYFHKQVRLSKKVHFVDSVPELMHDCDVLILAVSSEATREVAESIQPYAKDSLIILNTAKALDKTTGKRLSEIIAQTGLANNRYGLLAGGTIAKDLFQHEPLGVDLACKDSEALAMLTSLVSSENLSVYPTDDLPGVEYASSFKNVVSIFAGIIKGLGFSYGSETHMISHLAQKIGVVFVNDYGARAETFSIGSQSWGNDLWMSCTGNTRNREFGILLGQGMQVEKAEAVMAAQHKTVEGINTVRILGNLSSLKKIPELSLLHRLIVEKSITVEHLKQHLLTNAVN